AEILQQHPEIAPYVQRTRSRQIYLHDDIERADRQRRVRDTLLASQANETRRIYSILKRGGILTSGERDILYNAMVTPELKDYFKRHATPQGLADAFVKAEFFQYMTKLSQAFQDIPDTDYVARQAYLAKNPDLQDFW